MMSLPKNNGKRWENADLHVTKHIYRSKGFDESYPKT